MDYHEEREFIKQRINPTPVFRMKVKYRKNHSEFLKDQHPRCKK